MPTADVYVLMTELQATMTEIRTHMERIDTRAEYADRQVGDMEARLRVIESTSPGLRAGDTKELSGRVEALERFRYTLAGALALLAFVLSVVGAWIGTLISH